MRKETSAGLKAGAISGALAGFVFAAFAILTVTPYLESRFKASPILAPNSHALVLISDAFMVVMAVALASLLGAMAGFIFVKAVNKLPFRSTYVKAGLPWGVLLVLLTFVGLIYQPSMNWVIRFVTRELPQYALLVGDAILFAYLFNRWANYQQPSSSAQPPTSEQGSTHRFATQSS